MKVISGVLFLFVVFDINTMIICFNTYGICSVLSYNTMYNIITAIIKPYTRKQTNEDTKISITEFPKFN